MSSRKFIEARMPKELRLRVRYYKHTKQWLTRAQLIDRRNDEVIVTTFANCSHKDQPVRKIGRAIAVGRALKKYYGGERHE